MRSINSTKVDIAAIDNRCNAYHPLILSCGVTLRCQPSVFSQFPQVRFIHKKFENNACTQFFEPISKIIDLLQIDLQGCIQVLPSSVHELVRRTRIWVNLDYTYGSCNSPQRLQNPTTHHHESWLISNLDNPEKALGIEIYNASEYIKLRRYWNGCGLLLHELCHIIHQVVLINGLENEPVKQAYNHVVKCGKYDNVLRRDWIGLSCTTDIAYATVNCKEFFAELSVSFLSSGYPKLDLCHDDFLSLKHSPPFIDDIVQQCDQCATGHCNKFFPFTKGQLELYDPVLFGFMTDLWDEISVWNDTWTEDDDDIAKSLAIEDTVDL